ncbi:hypothetical protein D3C86_1570840 [compost metagenome]
MLLELGKLTIEEFDGFFGLGGLAFDVLAYVLGANFVECALEAIAVTVFERNTDHIRLLALFGELKAFLKIFGSGE